MIRIALIRLIANHTFKRIKNSPINSWLIGAFLILIAASLITSFQKNRAHQHDVNHYSKDVRERWENNPDKHPHRMAHYGYLAFRSKYQLSFFDSGMDNYLGNAVFLEAHKQNSVNFSQFSLSNGLMRFGALSTGLILQLLLPLLIFFWGYATISDERKNGVLKLVLTQGAKWREIIFGKSIGVFLISLTIALPAFIFCFLLLIAYPETLSIDYPILSFFGLLTSYLIYLAIMSFLSVWISAKSNSSKTSLLKLMGLWLFFTLIIPKISQFAGQSFYPTPSKIEFDTTVEHELIQLGDSHNPDDPHFNALKDSLLLTHNVSSTKDLPFNYSGYVMREGEKLSTLIYRKHKAKLNSLYHQQSQVVNKTGFINPYLAIKHISMVLSGTDFATYQKFNQATEDYRYNLAQTMNELQMKHISNTVSSSSDKNAVISRQNWVDFPEFEHDFLSPKDMAKTIIGSVAALLIWFIGLLFITFYLSKNLKAV